MIWQYLIRVVFDECVRLALCAALIGMGIIGTLSLLVYGLGCLILGHG